MTLHGAVTSVIVDLYLQQIKIGVSEVWIKNVFWKYSILWSILSAPLLYFTSNLLLLPVIFPGTTSISILNSPHLPLLQLICYSLPHFVLVVTYVTLFSDPIFIYLVAIFSSVQRMLLSYPLYTALLGYRIILTSKLFSILSFQKAPQFYYAIYITHSSSPSPSYLHRSLLREFH